MSTQKPAGAAPPNPERRKRRRLYLPEDAATPGDPQPAPAAAATEAPPLPEEAAPAARPIVFVVEDNRNQARDLAVQQTIRRHVALAAGTAIIPVPLIDAGICFGVQLSLVRELCRLYKVDYSQEQGRSLVAGLLAGYHCGIFARSMLKFVPVIGYTLSVASAGGMNGTVTYAIGKVFVAHFESGGILLTLDPERFRVRVQGEITKMGGGAGAAPKP